MMKPLLSAALVLLVANASLAAQEVQTEKPSATSLSSKIGDLCTVHFRNDIYASSGKSNLEMTGRLKDANSEWIVITRGLSEQWIPRGVVFYIDFSPKDAAAH